MGMAAALLPVAAVAQATAPALKVDWSKTIITSRTTPTLQVVVNPQLLRGAKLHDPSMAALKTLGADYVRYVPWLPYPRQSVAELDPPTKDKTSWDFQYIDPTLDDFMKANEGHSVVLNFSTMPAWLWKTDKPVEYPADPNQVFWKYTQGTEIKDPTYKEAAAYYARLLSWYTQGGFTDENGKRHESGHHYKVAYWEVLNEIDIEHKWKPEEYTKFFDACVEAMRKVQPDLKFMAVSVAFPREAGATWEYFLNPKNHKPGVNVDFITYHFYATPPKGEPFSAMQYTFFDMADGFLTGTKYIEQIKHRMMPDTRSDLNELGAILPTDGDSNNGAAHIPEPEGYWNLTSALYAYLYAKTAAIGIDVVGESQLIGYPTQYPSVSMMNYTTGDPNPRFWTLKLLHDTFGPGDTLVETTGSGSDITAQAFVTRAGKKLLVINKRSVPQTLTLAEGAMTSVSYIAPSTGDKPAAVKAMSGNTLQLEPFEVAVVDVK
jgi:hypothetical protein